MFSVTITSNARGSRTSCMAALSTSMCSSVTSGNSFATSITMRRHNCELSSTLFLSTDVRRLLRIPRQGEGEASHAFDLVVAVDQHVAHGLVSVFRLERLLAEV